jgi:hypothetical protein
MIQITAVVRALIRIEFHAEQLADSLSYMILVQNPEKRRDLTGLEEYVHSPVAAVRDSDVRDAEALNDSQILLKSGNLFVVEFVEEGEEMCAVGLLCPSHPCVLLWGEKTPVRAF